MEEYVNESPHYIDVRFNKEKKLSVSLKKGDFSASINMAYGSEVIRTFTRKNVSIATITDKVFSSPWDDIWLALTVAISQRALLLEKKKSHISEIMALKENEEFQVLFNRFCVNSSDRDTAGKIISIIQNSKNFPDLPAKIIWSVRLSDCIYALASYFKSKSHILSRQKVSREGRSNRINIFAHSPQ